MANLWICRIASSSRPLSSLWAIRFGPINIINPSICDVISAAAADVSEQTALG
jgi:hypothetical protein